MNAAEPTRLAFVGPPLSLLVKEMEGVQSSSYVLELLVMQLGFNQPFILQSYVRGNGVSGYTVQNIGTQKFLTEQVNRVIAAYEPDAIWDLVSESQDRFKFVYAAVVVDLD